MVQFHATDPATPLEAISQIAFDRQLGDFQRHFRRLVTERLPKWGQDRARVSNAVLELCAAYALSPLQD